MKRTLQRASAAALGLAMLGWAWTGQAQTTAAPAAPSTADMKPFIVQEGITRRISEHVWEIPDMSRPGTPNVAIVVGTRATLILDTGMGPRGGTAVAHEAQKLSGNTKFYLATTDFRPEHISGEMALPPGTVWIVPTAQKGDIATGTWKYINNFRARSADLAYALADVTLREPDVTFDQEATVDLGGGVKVRLMSFGPALFPGDLALFVEPDSVLQGGNFLASKSYPPIPEHNPELANYFNALDRMEALHPKIVMPHHGDMRDGTLIAGERTVLRDLERRSLELKAAGKSAAEAGKTLVAEFAAKYPDWGAGPDNIPPAVKSFYTETSSDAAQR